MPYVAYNQLSVHPPHASTERAHKQAAEHRAISRLVPRTLNAVLWAQTHGPFGDKEMNTAAAGCSPREDRVAFGMGGPYFAFRPAHWVRAAGAG